jgi:hypothetical protein
MKLYTAEVTCKICPHRVPLGQFYKKYDEEYYDRFLCLNESRPREILLHPSLDAPDWCKLEDVKE